MTFTKLKDYVIFTQLKDCVIFHSYVGLSEGTWKPWVYGKTPWKTLLFGTERVFGSHKQLDDGPVVLPQRLRTDSTDIMVAFVCCQHGRIHGHRRHRCGISVKSRVCSSRVAEFALVACQWAAGMQHTSGPSGFLAVRSST